MLSIVILLIVVTGVILYAGNMKKQTRVSDVIQTREDLDTAAKELDAVDVDGLGNELPQMDIDSSKF